MTTIAAPAKRQDPRTSAARCHAPRLRHRWHKTGTTCCICQATRKRALARP